MGWNIKRIAPPIPMLGILPDGKQRKVHAHFLIDYGYEHDLQWLCEVDETGEPWVIKNPLVRFQKNWSAGTSGGKVTAAVTAALR